MKTSKIFENRYSITFLSAMVFLVVLLGCSLSLRAEEKAVKVGVVLPLSGKVAEMGTMLMEGIEYVLDDELVKAGGIKSLGGAKVRILVGDTTSDPKATAGEMERVIAREKVCFVLGPHLTAESYVAAPIAERYKVPCISIRAAGGDLFEKGFHYWRTLAVPVQEYGITFGKWTHELTKEYDLKADSILVLWDDFSILRQMAEAMKGYYDEIGWSDRYEEMFFDPKAPDLTSVAAVAKAKNPDIIISPAFPGSGVNMLKAFDGLDFYPPIQIGPDMVLGSPKVMEALGPQLTEKMIMRPGVFFTAYFSPNDPRKEIQDFLKRAESYAKSKGIHATEADFVMGAQAAYVLWRVLETTGSTDPKILNEALHSLEMREGDPFFITQCFSPVLKWDQNGGAVHAALPLLQWRGKSQEIIYPKAMRSAEPRLP